MDERGGLNGEAPKGEEAPKGSTQRERERGTQEKERPKTTHGKRVVRNYE